MEDGRWKFSKIKLKNMKKILLIVVIAFSFSSCEKDDICDATTSTTPRVIVEFYDIAAQTTLKNVANLGVVSTGFETLAFNGVSKIQIPLNTATENATFNLVQNGTDTDATNDNTDVLTFTYTKETLYVSRACGYKIVFALTNTNDNILTTDTSNWIQDIVITKPNILNENETHIKIYF
jgi:hypothetical protein